MLWKIGENIIAGQVSATPKQDPGVSRYTKPMPRNGLESINSGASSCRYKYPRELRINHYIPVRIRVAPLKMNNKAAVYQTQASDTTALLLNQN